MTSTGYVHWEEGLFLRPHHLQMMQRHTHLDFADERRCFHVHPYGVIESKISADELRNMLVRFESLRAIMPSGQSVNVPGNAELPPLDIAKVFASRSGPLDVYLAVPLWYPTRGNSVDGESGGDWRTKRIFRISEVEAADENTGENPQPVRVRRINARLLLDGDDQTDFEVLKLLRIAHGVGEEVGVPRLDPSFVPPSLGLGGSPVLLTMLRDLANAVDASRRELVVQMRPGFDIEMIRGIQFEQMLRLQALSRAAARLPYLVEAEGVPLFQLYLELRELLGELAALQPNNDVFGAPDYDHKEPFHSFEELVNRIKSLLVGVVKKSFIKVDFALEGGVFTATLEDKHFKQPSDYLLAIKSKEDYTALAALVQDGGQFKLMPKSWTGKAFRGFKLTEVRQPPLQLPADADLHYFRMARDERNWDMVKQDRAITAQWDNCEVADVKLTLYMPVPLEEARR